VAAETDEMSFQLAWAEAIACWQAATEGAQPKAFADLPPLARHALQLVPNPPRELVWDVATMIGFAGIRLSDSDEAADSHALIAEAVDLIVAQREKEVGHLLNLPLAQAKPLMDEYPLHPHYRELLAYL
jgi:hypothetical protein